MSKFKNFGYPRPAPPSGPVFSGPVPKIKILLPTFFLPRCPNSEKVQHDHPAPKSSEEIVLAETPFLGSGPDPQSPWVQFTRPKVTCEELSGPENFAPIRSKRQKLRNFFAGTDAWTDGPTEHRCIFRSENKAFFYKSKVVGDLLKSDYDCMH